MTKQSLSLCTLIFMPHLPSPFGLPWWISGKRNPPANAGDMSSIPGLGRSPGEGNSYPLRYSCLGNPVDRGAWWATVHGVARVGHASATLQQQLSWFIWSNVNDRIPTSPPAPCSIQVLHRSICPVLSPSHFWSLFPRGPFQSERESSACIYLENQCCAKYWNSS